MSALARHSTRAPVSHDSSVPVAMASALLAAGVTWVLKPGGTRGEQMMILPEDLNTDDTQSNELDLDTDESSADYAVPELETEQASPLVKKLQADPETPPIKGNEPLQDTSSEDHGQMQVMEQTDPKPTLFRKIMDLSEKGKGMVATSSVKQETIPKHASPNEMKPNRLDSSEVKDSDPIVVQKSSPVEASSVQIGAQNQAEKTEQRNVEYINTSSENGKPMWF